MFTLYLLLTIIIFSFDIAAIIVHGKFVSKSTVDFYMNLDANELELNPLDYNILSNHNILEHNFIAVGNPYAWLSKYYIHNLGLVPRWSPLHKKIEEYYLIANKNKKNQLKW